METEGTSAPQTLRTRAFINRADSTAKALGSPDWCQTTEDNVTGSQKWDKKGQQMELLCNIYKEPKAGARKLQCYKR